MSSALLHSQPKVALTIAGSDSGGGAGIQADLKVFEAHQVFGTSAITVVTAQNTLGVHGIEALPAQFVVQQIEAVLNDFPVAAIKTGALANAEIVKAVAKALNQQQIPIVIDPVMLSKSGHSLLDDHAIQILIEELLPLATLITPNIPELEALKAAGMPEHFPLLLKGGHTHDQTVTDILRTPEHSLTLSAPRLETRHTHGTGCTLSAAITANLALDQSLPEAVQQAHSYLQKTLKAAPGLGAGHGPLGFKG